MTRHQPRHPLEDQLLDRVTAALDAHGIPFMIDGEVHPCTQAIWAAVGDYIRAVFADARANGLDLNKHT